MKNDSNGEGQSFLSHLSATHFIFHLAVAPKVTVKFFLCSIHV